MTFERREFARLLRRHPTKAEDILWQSLGRTEAEEADI